MWTGITRIGQCIGFATNNTVFPNTFSMDVEIDTSLPAMDQNNILASYGITDFIMFSKSTQVNRSSLLGYYSEVTFGNDSPHKGELFAISTEVSNSSK